MEEDKNGSDKNVGSIEKLIEELTKVRPDELSKDGLKLFEYINEIIDRNKELEEYYKEQNEVNAKFIPVSLVEEKIEELNKAYEDSKDENGESQYYYPDYTIRVLEELLEKRK